MATLFYAQNSITKILYICSMKLLCALLAFLVLTLTAQTPCIAANVAIDCCSDNQCEERTDHTKQESSKTQENRCTKGCNPFQACGCCAFSILIPVPFVITAPFFTPSAPINWGSKIMYLNEEPATSYWQPPKYT